MIKGAGQSVSMSQHVMIKSNASEMHIEQSGSVMYNGVSPVGSSRVNAEEKSGRVEFSNAK